MDREKMLAKLKEKRGNSKMSDEYKGAKKHLLKGLMAEMSGMMAEPLKGMKKVTVASDSEEGLKKGLEKAEEIVEAKSEEMPEEGMKEDEAEMSKEEIEAEIQRLMELKAQKGE